MPAIRPVYISTGEAAIKIASETLDGCYGLGCLSNAGYGYEKNMRAEYCSNRGAPLFYEAMTPGFRLDVSSKELSAVNFQLMGGSSLDIINGTEVTALNTVGNPAAVSSLTNPAEWHIVKLSGSAPWSFDVYTELKDLGWGGGTAANGFVKGTNIQVYTAAYTNGGTDVAAAAWLYSTTHVATKFTVDDACNGKVHFHLIADADLSQWTWNPSDPPFLINGVAPHIPTDLIMGDTVALIGISYFHSQLKDSTGEEIRDANRSIIQYPQAVEKPVFIKVVHRYSQDPDHFAQILRIWRAFNTTGMSQNMNPMTTTAHTLDASFRAADASDISPDSPMFHIEVVESTTTLTWESLLQLAAAG